MDELHQLPPTTCAYGRYDTGILIPDTWETECRLRELRWTREEFTGRTVLDLGCNSGILTVFALQLGAKRVKAVDPVEASVAAFAQVVGKHGLPVELKQATLAELEPEENIADIVLFMEVLHWAISQGMPLALVILKLWQMTRETLFIEFPWSVDEPSIKVQTSLTESEYSAYSILEELGKAFVKVELTSFMHYFGIGSASKRVLIRATQPRPEYFYTSTAPSTFSVSKLGEQSSNYVAPLITPSGMQFLKQFSPHSSFSHLPMDAAESLLAAICAVNPECLVVPVPVAGRYLMEHADGRYTILPFIQRHRESMDTFRPTSRSDLVSAILKLRKDLRRVQIPDLLCSEDILLRNHETQIPSTLFHHAETMISEARVTELMKVGLEGYRTHATEICHCDLQDGNVILSQAGSVRVVDLDSLAFGTAFTDGLSAMVWSGAPPGHFDEVIDALESDEGRQCTKTDCGIALLMLLHWFRAVEPEKNDDTKAIAQRTRRGLSSFLVWSFNRS